MPDITMCLDEACPSRHCCWRFSVTPSRWQSYAGFRREAGADRCVDYWPIAKDSTHEPR